MITIIYRKVDNAVVGEVYPPRSVHEVLASILVSPQLGGDAGDYAFAEIQAIPRGMVVRIENEQAMLVVDPMIAKIVAGREQVRAKFLALGFNVEDLIYLRI